MKSLFSKFLLASIVLYLLVIQQAFAAEKDYAPYPQPDAGYVSDYAGLLSEADEYRLESWLVQVERESNVEIIVVTINSMSDFQGTDNESIEQFASALFNKYGIGNMPKNDGVLLLVSKKDRKARIELGKHYGHQRDGAATDIMQSVIIPKFKRENYPAGIINGTEAIIEEFAQMRVTFPWHLVLMGGAALACLLIGISCIRNGKRGWGYVFIGLAIVLVLLTFYMFGKYLRAVEPSTRSGGLGGFGGGSSGGGGATGSW